MEGGLRVRLQFEDGRLLRKSQKMEGLKRCWLLLSPELDTISALASHIIHIFALQDSCPDGLLLSMEGFVLPSFESTCILKEKDIIRVKRKHGMLLGDGANLIEDSENVEKRPLLTGVKLLAFEGLKKTHSAHKELHEDAPCLENSSCGNMSLKKKRKNADNLHNLKRKKARSANPEKHLASTNEGVEEDDQTCENKSILCEGHLTRRSLHKKNNPSNVNSQSKAMISLGVLDEVENVHSISNDEGDDQLEADGGQVKLDVTYMLDGKKKFPSRRARRKKVKRKWLQELAMCQKKEVIQKQTDLQKKSSEHQQPEKESIDLAESQKDEPIHKQILEKEMHKKSPECQQPDQDTDAEDEIVPVIIRPGHIRFERLDKEQSNWELKDPVYGTTGKKNQKGGIEKTSVYGRNDSEDLAVNINQKLNGDGEPVHAPVDFEKLLLLSGKPKEGDVIAYRLVELSSSWCPKLSSFRVGKVSSYDSFSEKIILLPVHDYPIILNEKKDEIAIELLSSGSLYNADGSLEIDFASLIDVRTLDHGKSDPNTVIKYGNEALVSSQAQEAEAGDETSDNGQITTPPIIESGAKETDWDAIIKVSSEEKEQLLQSSGWDTAANSTMGGWVQPSQNNGWGTAANSTMGQWVQLSRNNGWGNTENSTKSRWAQRSQDNVQLSRNNCWGNTANLTKSRWAQRSQDNVWGNTVNSINSGWEQPSQNSGWGVRASSNERRRPYEAMRGRGCGRVRDRGRGRAHGRQWPR